MRVLKLNAKLILSYDIPPPTAMGGGQSLEVFVLSDFDEIRNYRVFDSPEHIRSQLFHIMNPPPPSPLVGGGVKSQNYCFRHIFMKFGAKGFWRVLNMNLKLMN